jgi:hypothetical protein
MQMEGVVKKMPDIVGKLQEVSGFGEVKCKNMVMT